MCLTKLNFAKGVWKIENWTRLSVQIRWGISYLRKGDYNLRIDIIKNVYSELIIRGLYSITLGYGVSIYVDIKLLLSRIKIKTTSEFKFNNLKLAFDFKITDWITIIGCKEKRKAFI